MKQKTSAINITYQSGISVVPNIEIKSVTGFRALTALNSDCNYIIKIFNYYQKKEFFFTIGLTTVQKTSK